MKPRLFALLACAFSCVSMGGASGWEPRALAETEARAIVDRVVVRFFAPETGGSRKPRFITERVLAFEARLEAMSEDSAKGRIEAERNLRNALDRHVVEEILASLYVSSGTKSDDDARLVREARVDLEQRAGGDGPIGIAAEEEGMSAQEIEEVFTRRAHAAAYLDRNVTRFLHPPDEQLREVYRSSQHPFRAQSFVDVRGPLLRWFVFERLKVLEAAFLQTARSRVTVVVAPR